MSKNDIPVPLYFITGFLGAGKTTLLMRVVDEATQQGKKIGVIINEWGQASVDSVIVHDRDVEIAELNNGQVFCSCLSVDFIKVLALYAERDLDAVIVETSGMANPLPLHKLLRDLQQATKTHYDYRGMTALVDPDSFLDLVGAFNAVDEQIAASQRIVINKTDLATEAKLAEVRARILLLNPRAEVLETSFAKVERFFDAPSCPVPSLSRYTAEQSDDTCPTPENFLIKTGESLSGDQVKAFFRQILPKALRMKGVFHAPDGKWYYADGVNDQVSIQQLDHAGEKTLFVVIPRTNYALKGSIRKAWMLHCKVSFALS